MTAGEKKKIKRQRKKYPLMRAQTEDENMRHRALMKKGAPPKSKYHTKTRPTPL